MACSGGAAMARDQVWAGLFLAENGPPRAGVVLAAEPLGDRLRATFGFKHYELLKSQNFELNNEWQQWFVPRHDFFIRFEPLPHQPGEPRWVAYEIYDEGFIVANGTYQPRKDRPLFINGPDFREGRLVLVLEPRAASLPE